MVTLTWLSISGNKSHFDIPIRPTDKGDGHSDGLMVVLQSELLDHLDRQHVHLQLGKPPPDAHPRAKAEGNGSEGMGSVLTRTSAQPQLRLELLRLGEVLLIVHGKQVPGSHLISVADVTSGVSVQIFEQVAIGDHRPLTAAKHRVLGGLPLQSRDCWLHPLALVQAGFQVPHPSSGDWQLPGP